MAFIGRGEDMKKKESRRKHDEIKLDTEYQEVKSSNIIYEVNAAMRISYGEDTTSESWLELLDAMKLDARKHPALFLTHHHGHIDWNIDFVPTISDYRDPPKLAEFLLIAFAT